jgi:hypothetical protein
MVFSDDAWVWSCKPSTTELCRRAKAVIADLKATIPQTRRVIEECWRRLHRCPVAHKGRPQAEPDSNCQPA